MNAIAALEGRSWKAILTLNDGSSSVRFALFHAAEPLPPILRGKFERIGLPHATLTLTDAGATPPVESPIDAPDNTACIPILVDLLQRRLGAGALRAIGHRIVHGGPQYRQPVRVDDAVMRELRRIIPFAPNHLPGALALMDACAAQFPAAPQVACFDTAFHAALPRVARLLPIPRRFEAKGVHRYGFHGLSYAFLMQELARVAGPEVARGRVILAHLGNGASMAAVRDGQSIDTSMGFTPAAGLVMSTRSGDIDPGLVEFLADDEHMSPAQFDHMIHHESGLLGLSETSSDMRDLFARAPTDVRAAEAVAVFCYQAKKWLGAFAAALGGLETVVFSGGIGENNPAIRARICEGLGFLGLDLDEAQNAVNAPVISPASGRVSVRVLRTDEERMMARSAYELLGLGAETSTDGNK